VAKVIITSDPAHTGVGETAVTLMAGCAQLKTATRENEITSENLRRPNLLPTSVFRWCKVGSIDIGVY